MFATVTLSLLEGFGGTLKLFVLTLLFALPLGLVISFGSMSKVSLIRVPIRFLIWVIRGTPLMLQLLVVYYGPGIIFGNNIWGSRDTGRFLAALFSFVINYSCYFSEIFRQVILLQVIKRIVPPISNEIITLVKDTSLARVIAVYEIIWKGQAFIKSAGIIWPLFYTGVFYLLFSGLLTLLFGLIEKKLNYFR